MPIRAFVGQNLTQLQASLSVLERSLASGSLTELRVAGITTRTSGVSQAEIQILYNQVRYELYLRAKALASDDPNRAALIAQFTNPYCEPTMRVESRYHGGHHFPGGCA